MSDEEHYKFMRIALEEAEKCTPVPTAFCVGCVLVSRNGGDPAVIATGYSRELPGNTHAEANALAKFRSSPEEKLITGESPQDILASADVYTTMEPCSIRTSGLAPCADALIAAQVKRCFIGVGEPDDFVKCEGAQKLTEAGIQVVWLKGMEEEALAIARKGRA
ncbi:hypothetical protein D9757_007712 [Collybiopsis confluens]|uniref:CMP/dCMP-type deaminase domain-containing protein n=1 Tax=Collybiopsis confluens TaxID=2823264 RepID=A0A8H5H583_9AGAR|nr:hypothetical protein D9757_007712 [Collybiopsis confluens]